MFRYVAFVFYEKVFVKLINKSCPVHCMPLNCLTSFHTCIMCQEKGRQTVKFAVIFSGRASFKMAVLIRLCLFAEDSCFNMFKINI